MDSIKIKTPLGVYLAQASEKGIETLIPFSEQDHDKITLNSKNKLTSSALINLEVQLKEYFSGNRKSFQLKLAPQGTTFQQNVWKSLLKTSYGKTVCYQDIANDLKKPKANRAVGSANGKNPIHIIIPCHRIIRKDGGLGGYAAGLSKKTKLLDLEKKYK